VHPVRLATFGEDPYFELDVSDLMRGLAAAGHAIEVIARIDYEAVVEAPSARRLVAVQALALGDVRQVAAGQMDLRLLGHGLAQATAAARAAEVHRSKQTMEALDALQGSLDASTQRVGTLDSDQKALCAVVGQTQSDLHTLATEWRRAIVTNDERATTVHAGLLKLQSVLEAQSAEASTQREAIVDRLQQIEARLTRAQSRSWWSWLKPDRG
jgi:hypothetical protein